LAAPEEWTMMRRSHLLGVCVVALMPALPMVGGAGDKGGKDKHDVLVAAMKFVKVPKGTFWMGGGSGTKPSKQVEIKADFELVAYTVTQEQWQAIMGSNPSTFSRQGRFKNKVKDIPDADLKRFPIENVSWNDCLAFLQKLNEQQQGKGWRYRLPTEAEWEYACRNAATSKEECSFDFYFDKPTNDLSSRQANFNGNYPAGKAAEGPWLGRPAKVGSYAPNKLGLYDMHGNVRQWCEGQSSGVLVRVDRGGSWFDSHDDCRASSRDAGLSDETRNETRGLRLARMPSGAK